jgi:hypothetical protein
MLSTAPPEVRVEIVSETARQIIQMRRIGDITETSNAFVTALQWLQDFLKVIRDFVSGDRNTPLETEIRQTEAVLDDLDIRVQPADDISVRATAEGFTPDPDYGKTKLVEVPADAPTDRWRKTSEKLPQGWGKVWVYRKNTRGQDLLTVVNVHIVRRSPLLYPYWMPIETPEPPTPEAQADAKRLAGVKTWEGEDA